MEIIYFIYGLSFFVFGILVLFARTKDSNLFFADKIWFLGMFAILHAIVEWLDLYEIIYPLLEDTLIPIKIILLLLSYILLFEFSRFILRKSFENKKSKYYFVYHIYSAPIIYTFGTSLLILHMLLYPGWNETIVAIRYTYGFFFLGGVIFSWYRTLFL